ncbi:peptidoglycan DD-metalloendopeptidase family protein, partial [bacterium]|nr:peptidoglycan DD-metalloendopeptidase family protein [bacterium]
MRHANGYTTRYAHLSSAAVSLGDTIHAGQIIGASGNTGRSTAPHLHFDVRNHSDNAVDPFGWTGNYTDPWQAYNGTISSCLWKDGEWANLCGGVRRPIPAPHSGGEITVADSPINAGGFAKGGGGIPNNACAGNCQSWTRTASGFMYYTTADRGNNSHDQWARWQPPLPTDEGIYEVLVYVPNQYATTWRAPYVILHRNGTSSAMVDQNGLSNQWVSIGTYRMAAGDYVYTHDATGEGSNQRWLGVDNVKFVRRSTTYAPLINQGNGWSSTFYVRSNGGDARATFNVFDSSGVRQCYGTAMITAHSSVPFACPLLNGVYSLVVDGSQDLSVVVYTDGAARGSLDNGFLPQGVGDATFEQAGTVLYAPAFYKNYFSINSSVSIVNVGSVPTTVNVEFIGRTGYTNTVHTTPNIPAGGRVTVNGSPIPQTPWVGSLRLTSTGVGSSPAQPIVAMVNDDTTANPVYSRSYNATKFGSPLVYVPAAYRNQWGFNTGLVVQNLGTSTTDATLTFCPRLVTDLSNECHPFTINNLEPGKAQGVLLSNLSFLSDGWTGSVKLQTTTSGVPIAVAVTNSYDNVGGYNFSATGRGGRTVFLPYAAKNANGISTGYTVRNTSGMTITVQALYYNQNGTRRTNAD